MDAGKRMADQINARLTFGNPFELRTSFMAFYLNDGSTNGDVYENLKDAKRFTDPSRVCYFSFLNYLGGISAYECAVYLQFHREAREVGLGQADSEAIPFMSTYGHDVMSGRIDPGMN